MQKPSLTTYFLVVAFITKFQKISSVIKYNKLTTWTVNCNTNFPSSRRGPHSLNEVAITSYNFCFRKKVTYLFLGQMDRASKIYFTVFKYKLIRYYARIIHLKFLDFKMKKWELKYRLIFKWKMLKCTEHLYLKSCNVES